MFVPILLVFIVIVFHLTMAHYIEDIALLSSITSLAGLLIVVTGWIYNSKLADSRETRKELMAEINDINKNIDLILTMIKDHDFRQDGQNTNLIKSENLIIAKSHLVLRQTEHLIDNRSFNKFKMEKKLCLNSVANFWESVSEDNLKSQDSSINFEQYYHANDLMIHLNQLFRKCFS